MDKPPSIYYATTITYLERGEYLSPRQMIAEMEDLPFFDTEHARSEILKAVQFYNQWK